MYLENQFNSLQLDNFSDIITYCQQLKKLRDQLANVDQNIYGYNNIILTRLGKLSIVEV